jgi:hypothetical protein
LTLDERSMHGTHVDHREEAGLFARFWYGSPPATAGSSRGYAEGQPGYAQFELGRAALLDARALGNAREGLGSALLLYRAAVLLLSEARRLRRLQRLRREATVLATEPTPLGAAPNADELLAPLAPEERRLLEPLLDCARGEARLAALGEAERRRVLDTLAGLAQKLAEPLEAEADVVRRQRVACWLRRLIPIALASVLFGYSLLALLGRENLALHKPVVVSSAEPKVRANPRQLVDGDHKNLAFHTQKGAGQHATIDLGTVQQITTIDVYNRFDCCQGRALPLRIEVSTDGRTYQSVARRTESFTLWSAALPPTAARYVRLIAEANTFFHLTEVEVY